MHRLRLRELRLYVAGAALTARAAGLSAAAAICAVLTAPARAQDKATDSTATSWTYDTPNARFRAEIIATGLKAPVSFSFLPDGRMLVADRPTGQLMIMDVSSGAMTPIAGVPPVHGVIDGGLLEVLVHPDYVRNGWIYLAYASADSAGNGLVVERAHLSGATLVARQQLFIAQPRLLNSDEFGARLVLDGGYLFISVGQRGTPAAAQDLGSDLGKLIRLYEDGRVPPANPFVDKQGARPEIWAYGVRNPVGLAIDPHTGALWEHEHGPRGGDEVNVIRAGQNYGWPVIGYGIQYNGALVGTGITHQQGMEQPTYYWFPDIAPTGMFFYTGSAFPGWRNSVFIGALVRGHLNRLAVEGDRVIHEERLLEDRRWRVRGVQQGPDGSIYLGIDGGLIVRLRPLPGGNAHPQ